MNRSELVQIVARRTEVRESVVEDVIGTFLDLVVMNLAIDEEVTLRGFGKFVPVNRPAVTLQNKVTKEPVNVGPRKSMAFKPSPIIKERLNADPF